MFEGDRITNPAIIDRKLILAELKKGNEITLQFSYKKYNDDLLAEIDAVCKIADENFSVRFYDHGKTGFNCQTLLKIPHVKNLYIDCMNDARNLKSLGDLSKLHTLRLGIFNFDEPELLQCSNLKTLYDLGITKTKNNKLNLLYLKDYNNLTTLELDGHNTNIESVGKIKNLTSLYLSLPKKTSVEFINNSSSLKNLHFVLGSRENINEIGPNKIETLQIERVLGFNDISNINHFSKLKKLRIADAPQLSHINFSNNFPALTDISIANCKSLQTINGLMNVPRLTNLHIFNIGIPFDTFMQQPLPSSLKYFNFYTSKMKEDAANKKILESKGYTCG